MANPPLMEQEWIDGAEGLADYLGVSINTVYAWRAHSKGPRAYRIGKGLRFRRSDVEEWIEQQADPR